MAAALIMNVAYGITIQLSDDPYVDLVKEAMHAISVSSIPGQFLVVSPPRLVYIRSITTSSSQDTIPALQYVPSWFPGADFKRKAEKWRTVMRELLERPFQEAKRNIVR